MAAAAALADVPPRQGAGLAERAGGSKGLTEVEGLRVGHITLSRTADRLHRRARGRRRRRRRRLAARRRTGTRETDLLDPLNMVDKVNAIVLVRRQRLRARRRSGRGRATSRSATSAGKSARHGVVPIVPAAILFDLGFRRRPEDPADRRLRLQGGAAGDGRAGAEGNVGAGAGATVGKLAGSGRAMKGGIGTAAITLPNGLVVAALVAVNAVGDVIDPCDRRRSSPARAPSDGKSLADARKLLAIRQPCRRPPRHGPARTPRLRSSPPTRG